MGYHYPLPSWVYQQRARWEAGSSGPQVCIAVGCKPASPATGNYCTALPVLLTPPTLHPSLNDFSGINCQRQNWWVEEVALCHVLPNCPPESVTKQLSQTAVCHLVKVGVDSTAAGGNKSGSGSSTSQPSAPRATAHALLP